MLIDITVPLAPPKIRQVSLPHGRPRRSKRRRCSARDTKVVAALHHVSGVHLADPDHAVECDVLVCSDDARGPGARRSRLIADLGLRGVRRRAARQRDRARIADAGLAPPEQALRFERHRHPHHGHRASAARLSSRGGELRHQPQRFGLRGADQHRAELGRLSTAESGRGCARAGPTRWSRSTSASGTAAIASFLRPSR